MKMLFALLFVGMLFFVIGCIEPRYIDVICDPEFPELCDTSCISNADCVSSCCGCISKNEDCYAPDMLCERIYCKCENGFCTTRDMTDYTCETLEDCEGLSPSPMQCMGEWACIGGKCEWQCQVECGIDEDCPNDERNGYICLKGACFQKWYIGCGCGCCGGIDYSEAQKECLYRSEGDNLEELVERENELASNPDLCANVGCSFPINYTYCIASES